MGGHDAAPKGRATLARPNRQQQSVALVAAHEGGGVAASHRQSAAAHHPDPRHAGGNRDHGGNHHHNPYHVKDHSPHYHGLFDELLDEDAFLSSLLERKPDNVHSRARQRVDFIKKNIDATFAKDRPSLQKLLSQIELANKIEEQLHMHVVGVFHPDHPELLETHRQSAVTFGGIQSQSSSSQKDSGGDPGSLSSALKRSSAVGGAKGSSTSSSRRSVVGFSESIEKFDPNKINITEDGVVCIGRCSEMQPLLRLVDEVCDVEVRPAKSLGVITKLIGELYVSVAEDLIKGGKFKFDGYKAIRTMGFDLSETPAMLTGGELREYEKSIYGMAPEPTTSLEEVSVAAAIGRYSSFAQLGGATQAGGTQQQQTQMQMQMQKKGNAHEYWRPLHSSGPDLVYHAILKIRGNAKACDQQIIDLVKSSTTYRGMDEDISVFCQLMEVDNQRSSSLSVALYIRYELQRVQVAAADAEHIPCVTYASVIALASKLFQVDDALVQKAAKKVIQFWEVDKNADVSSKTSLKIEAQIEHFFVLVWKAARAPEEGGGLSYAGLGRGKTDAGSTTTTTTMSSVVTSSSNSSSSITATVGSSATGTATSDGGGRAAGLPQEQAGGGEAENKEEDNSGHRRSLNVGGVIAARKTKQIISSRRKSIVEMSQMMSFDEDDDGVDLEALLEGDEHADEHYDDDDDDDEHDKVTKRRATAMDTLSMAAAGVKVKEEMYRWLCPVGAVLDICLAAHKQHCERQLHGVWSTVVFVMSDTQQKGVLTIEQFSEALENTSPKRNKEELRELYSDLIYGSSNQLMTYCTFKTSTFQLMNDGFLELSEPDAGDILDVALAIELKHYVALS